MTTSRRPAALLLALTLAAALGSSVAQELQTFDVPAGSRPHDVAPAADGGAWYTAQGSGEFGWLDPGTGETRHVALGSGSRPHGVIVGPDGAPWITDSGRNATVRVDPTSWSVEAYPLPEAEQTVLSCPTGHARSHDNGTRRALPSACDSTGRPQAARQTSRTRRRTCVTLVSSGP